MVSDMTCDDIRKLLVRKYRKKDFSVDKSGQKLIELIGVSFKADEESILGIPNYDYIEREIEWYRSESLKVDDIPGKTPKIWSFISSFNGEINSNYGWCIWSEENGNQYRNVLNELKRDSGSRRTSMIYQRPSMHTDYCRNGMSDFICTHSVDYFIRDNQLYSVVHMRSNDIWAGYRNDRAWQQFVQTMLAIDLGVEIGDLYWTVSSMHLYEKQFYLLHHYMRTGDIHISKEAFRQRYKNNKLGK